MWLVRLTVQGGVEAKADQPKTGHRRSNSGENAAELTLVTNSMIKDSK